MCILRARERFQVRWKREIIGILFLFYHNPQAKKRERATTRKEISGKEKWKILILGTLDYHIVVFFLVPQPATSVHITTSELSLLVDLLSVSHCLTSLRFASSLASQLLPPSARNQRPSYRSQTPSTLSQPALETSCRLPFNQSAADEIRNYLGTRASYQTSTSERILYSSPPLYLSTSPPLHLYRLLLLRLLLLLLERDIAIPTNGLAFSIRLATSTCHSSMLSLR